MCHVQCPTNQTIKHIIFVVLSIRITRHQIALRYHSKKGGGPRSKRTAGREYDREGTFERPVSEHVARTHDDADDILQSVVTPPPLSKLDCVVVPARAGGFRDELSVPHYAVPLKCKQWMASSIAREQFAGLTVSWSVF